MPFSHNMCKKLLPCYRDPTSDAHSRKSDSSCCNLIEESLLVDETWQAGCSCISPLMEGMSNQVLPQTDSSTGRPFEAVFSFPQVPHLGGHVRHAGMSGVSKEMSLQGILEHVLYEKAVLVWCNVPFRLLEISARCS